MTGDDPFGAYHRAQRWMTLRRTIATVTVSVALAVGLTAWAGAAPAPPVAPPASAVADAPVEPSPSPTPSVAPTALPAPPAAPPEPPPPLPTTGTSEWAIMIDTAGYQAEIDRCLWVRMDLGIPAPIVGAHNSCGGGIVLEMTIGDTVTLSGTELDGVYTVSAARDARAGDSAVTATAGLDADVILQTCYWENDGRVLLLALVRAGRAN